MKIAHFWNSSNAGSNHINKTYRSHGATFVLLASSNYGGSKKISLVKQGQMVMYPPVAREGIFLSQHWRDGAGHFPLHLPKIPSCNWQNCGLGVQKGRNEVTRGKLEANASPRLKCLEPGSWCPRIDHIFPDFARPKTLRGAELE